MRWNRWAAKNDDPIQKIGNLAEENKNPPQENDGLMLDENLARGKDDLTLDDESTEQENGNLTRQNENPVQGDVNPVPNGNPNPVGFTWENLQLKFEAKKDDVMNTDVRLPARKLDGTLMIFKPDPYYQTRTDFVEMCKKLTYIEKPAFFADRGSLRFATIELTHPLMIRITEDAQNRFNSLKPWSHWKTTGAEETFRAYVDDINTSWKKAMEKAKAKKKLSSNGEGVPKSENILELAGMTFDDPNYLQVSISLSSLFVLFSGGIWC